MIPPSEKALRAMVRIMGDTKAEDFLAWLEDSLTSDSLENNNVMDDRTSVFNKGANKRTEEIISTLRGAQDLLSRRQNNEAQDKAAGGLY